MLVALHRAGSRAGGEEKGGEGKDSARSAKFKFWLKYSNGQKGTEMSLVHDGLRSLLCSKEEAMG